MDFRLKIVLSLLFVGFTALLIWSYTPAFAATLLKSFTITETSNGTVELKWETATEQNTLEFYVRRVRDSADNFTSVSYAYDPATDSQLIPVLYQGNSVTGIAAEGGPASGATYMAIDENVVDGETYVYMLIQLELNGEFYPADDGDEHIKHIIVGASHIYLPIVSGSNTASASHIYLPIIKK